LAKIKADFLLAREEWEGQISKEQEKNELWKKKFNALKSKSDRGQELHYQNEGESSLVESDGLQTPHKRNQSQSSLTGSGGSNGPTRSLGNTNLNFQISGLTDEPMDISKYRRVGSSSQSVVSMGSEFAQKARSLVDVMSCMNIGGKDGNFRNSGNMEIRNRSHQSNSGSNNG